MKKRMGMWLALLSMAALGLVHSSRADIGYSPPGGSGSGSGCEPSGNGINVRTGSGTCTNRSVTSSDGSLTVSNGDGVSGNVDAVVDTAVFSRYSSGTGDVSATGSVGTFYAETDANSFYTYPSTDTEHWLLSIAGEQAADAFFYSSGVDVLSALSGVDGELITWDASGNPATVAAGTATHVLTSNGAGAAPTFQAAAGGSGFDPATTARFYEDFGFKCQDMNDFDCASAGTGASLNIGTGEANHPGVLVIDVGTTTTGYSRVATDDQVFLGSGEVVFKGSMKTGSTLSDATDGYLLRMGLTVGGSAETDYCLVRYEDDINSGKWEYACANSGSESVADSGVTVATNTWYGFVITVNSDASSVNFTVNGSGSQNITTNIPSAGVRIGAGGLKTSGTTVENVGLIDYLYCGMTVTR